MFGIEISFIATNFRVDLSLDLSVIAAGFVVSLVTGLTTGIAPALQATRTGALPALKDETSALARAGRGCAMG